MNERAILRFQLWGIPVTIYPLSWVLLLILGGGLGVSSGAQLPGVLLFVVAGMLCLLVHELGHALLGRRLTGQRPSIIINMLGGGTEQPYWLMSRRGYFAVVLAGPAATLLLGLLGGAAFGLHLGNLGAGLVYSLLFPLGLVPDAGILLAAEEAGMLPMVLAFYQRLFIVCVWWTIFNLLPMLPLDGGHLLATLLGNNKSAALVGLLFGGTLTAFCLLLTLAGGSLLNTLIIGYMTYYNYKLWRSL